MHRLQCPVQCYEWGKVGSTSLVAQFKRSAEPGFAMVESKHYAELWMGTHPNGPCTLSIDNNSSDMLLSEYLEGNQLPFLFKVLSVDVALSVQAHPDKQLARALHATAPELYKDSNHKPEMAIALTEFEALCQFRPEDEIVSALLNVPELSIIVDHAAKDAFIAFPNEKTLERLFTSYINCNDDALVPAISQLKQRLREATDTSSVEKLVLRLMEQYPNDIGIFAPFWLNYLKLQPGEAVFLDANEPHSYISGDCIEAMACSDNVVRAGLTKKHIDRPTLCHMLNYQFGCPKVLKGEREQGYTLYTPPVTEFQIERHAVGDGDGEYELHSVSGISIILITNGEGMASCKSREFSLHKGVVLVQDAKTTARLVSTNNNGVELEFFRVHVNEA